MSSSSSLPLREEDQRIYNEVCAVLDEAKRKELLNALDG